MKSGRSEYIVHSLSSMADQGGLTNISQLTGPLFLGCLFNWALFGALSVQVYLYYLSFPQDKAFPTKALVVFVYVYEVVQTCLITRDGFNYFVSGFDNLVGLNQVDWAWITIPLMTSIISAVAQVFYAWRIYILSRQAYLPILIVLIACVVVAGGVWTGVVADRVIVWSEVRTHARTPVIVWLAGTAVCDVVITTTMLWYLATSRNGFDRTNALLVKLIRITVETGLITAAVAVVDLTLFLVFESNNFHLTPAIALSKLYSNSLMALLNSRIRIVGGRSTGASAHDATLAQGSWGRGDRFGGVSTQLNMTISSSVVTDSVEVGEGDTTVDTKPVDPPISNSSVHWGRHPFDAYKSQSNPDSISTRTLDRG